MSVSLSVRVCFLLNKVKGLELLFQSRINIQGTYLPFCIPDSLLHKQISSIPACSDSGVSHHKVTEGLSVNTQEYKMCLFAETLVLLSRNYAVSITMATSNCG